MSVLGGSQIIFKGVLFFEENGRARAGQSPVKSALFFGESFVIVFPHQDNADRFQRVGYYPVQIEMPAAGTKATFLFAKPLPPEEAAAIGSDMTKLLCDMATK